MGSRLSPCPTTVLHRRLHIPLTCHALWCVTIHILAQALYQKVRPFAIIALAASHIFISAHIYTLFGPLNFYCVLFLQHGRKDSSFMFTKTSIVFVYHSVCSCLFWLGAFGKNRLCSEDVYAALMGRFQARLIFSTLFS